MEIEEFFNILLILFLMALMISISTCFPSTYTSIKKLELEDTLAEYHVLKYYPEFENCTIVYDHIRKGIYGTKVYCGNYEKLESLDGMRVVEESRIPTKELIFDDIKLKDIYWNWKANLK
jgi:hypothetical protein